MPEGSELALTQNGRLRLEYLYNAENVTSKNMPNTQQGYLAYRLFFISKYVIRSWPSKRFNLPLMK